MERELKTLAETLRAGQIKSKQGSYYMSGGRRPSVHGRCFGKPVVVFGVTLRSTRMILKPSASCHRPKKLCSITATHASHSNGC
jgi:hypothetical protein